MTEAFPISVRGVRREIPLRNFAGINYLTPVDACFERQIGIRKGERVLDIGGGDHPFSRADVVTDPFLNDSSHRGGRPVPRDKKYVECFAEKMPFRDKEFDFALSRHVFEHTLDPGAACREMSRVARRGFIEVPVWWHEYFYGYPVHRWLISVEKGVLVFRPKAFVRSPFFNCLLWMIYHDVDFTLRWEYEYRNLTSIQFPWEGEVQYRVEGGAGFDFENRPAVAEGHLQLVQDGLQFGGVPVPILLQELKNALDLHPEYPEALNTLGVIYAGEKEYEKSQKAFREARALDPGDPVHAFNTQVFLPVESPQLKSLPPEIWDGGDAPAENHAGTNYFTACPDLDELLAQQLSLSEACGILDITSDAPPFSHATDSFNVQSEETGLLPYADRSFDVAVCFCILQQLRDPETLCREMQRVARRGFIEVPRFFWEYVCGHPRNLWLCDLEEGTLVFRRKNFTKNPFKNILTPILSIHPDLQYRFEVTLRNLSYIQLEWRDSFAYRIEAGPACPDAQNTGDLFVSSLDYVLNLCSRGASDLAMGDAALLADRAQTRSLGLTLQGMILLHTGDAENGLKLLQEGVALDPENPALAGNLHSLMESLGQARSA